MIEPWEKSQTPELKKLVQKLKDHSVSNPDDNPNLTGEEFLSTTDETSRDLIREIAEVGAVVLFDREGRRQGQSAAAMRRAGYTVSEVGDPHDENDRYKTTLQITTNHGVLTFVAPLLGR
ncbi:hypothetical protein HX882_27185 [Pseudomonas gingeri]|uniref:Uncharacterized protein n=1 Tax=Pseudomonas gingeri TaxID=117681 RepID=A0A7Y7XGT2_9PSED|nr:hypothetical protein [Pseudomonas gingeri]NWA25570.1 hypothetical protein [Pseudomonas gingeri]NWB99575.1 hypothetical protein [Pseudomonas gingeri]